MFQSRNLYMGGGNFCGEGLYMGGGGFCVEGLNMGDGSFCFSGMIEEVGAVVRPDRAGGGSGGGFPLNKLAI